MRLSYWVVVAFVLGTVLVPTAVAQSGGHHEDEGHSERAGFWETIHLPVEVAQILLSVFAIAAIGLAGRSYGGKVGTGLLVGGVGIGLFAVERLWHNLGEFGVVAGPGVATRNLALLVATLAMGAGYGLLYKNVRDLHG